MQLAERLNTISEPQTIKMAKLSREMKAQGISIVDLSLGEPDFRTPDHINEAAIKAINEGYSKYTPVAGYPELLEAISIKLKRDNNLDYPPNQIIVSTGAKQSLIDAVMSIVDPGDEVIIPTPFWVTYATQVEMAGGIVKYVRCGIDQDFKMSPEQLEAAITPKTKLFMFSSPCNPTGSVYSKEELAGLVAVFKRYPYVAIISDEIYEYINFVGGHESIAQFEEIRDRVVVINGMSKGFAMTGWRLGYMAGPLDIVKACDKLQAQSTSGANSVAQRASITALLSDLEPTHKMVAAYKERCDYVIGALKKMPGVKANYPHGAFYAFPDISSFFGKSDGETVINDDVDMSMYLLNKGHVTTVCGSAFGDPHCLRLSFATSMTNLQEAMTRMAAALSRLS
ncbi:aspartate aminotransferase [Flavipsychrobacter stenotrophus]|uniref:Aminotransferase n=1 Tax=Flavipsychrobacter stenotrophus TaxID=2077091 RepID=A0A2S7SY43_9BACT|nr:pyridoxal phosphate-dependent aminotransferase [Flavipsychrobacter stenotrophus]PQJ11551.1 aspartate aminotransferase [Flavipsychrobacter stenotrophus]